MRFRALLLGCLLAAFAAGSSVAAQTEAGLAVTWTANGTVGYWQQGSPAPQQLTAQDAIEPFVSPDGLKIAYTAGVNSLPDTLWLIRANGDQQALVTAADLDGGLIAQVGWLDADTLLFNTTVIAGPLGASPRDDLYRVDVASGDINQLRPPGEAGAFSIGPAGTQVALAYAGAFDEAGTPTRNGEIRVMDGNGENERTLHTFTPVSTGSPNRFYPDLFWLPGDDAFYSAIPPQDIILEGGETALWRFDTAADTAELVGSVNADYFQPPRWSADGSALAYGAPPDDTPTGALFTAAPDGTNPVLIGEDVLFGPFRWAQTGAAFAYASAPNRVEVGSVGTSDVTTVEGQALRYRLLDADHLLVVVIENGWLVLQYRDIRSGEVTELTRGGFENDILFDAVFLP